MKKRLLLLSLLAVCCCAALFACAAPDAYEELAGRGYNITVRYECNGGKFNDNENVSIETLYKVPEGGRTFLAPPVRENMGASITLGKEGHFLEGWYTDAAFTDKWDFEKDTTDKSMTLYAKWLENFRYDVCYIDEDGNEHVLSKVDVAMGGVYPTLDLAPVREGYTFLRKWYSDAACTVEWDPAHTHGGTIVNGELSGQVEKLYTQWLEGEYKLVESAKDMATIAANASYYLLNDIDFTGLYWTGCNVQFSGKIIGNGHTIKGINLFYGKNPYKVPDGYDTKTDPDDYIGTLVGTTTTSVGIFGGLRAGATLKDVTFDDVRLVVDYGLTKNEKNAGLLAGTAAENVTFENVQVQGQITVKSLPANAESTFYLGYLCGTSASPLTGIKGNITLKNETTNMLLTPGDDDNSIVITRKQD